MFGLFAVFGPVIREFPVERFRDIWVPNSQMEILSNNTNFVMARFTPENHPEKPTFYSSGDDNLHLAIDGYVITQSAQTTSGLRAQVDSLMKSFQRKGISDGLGDLVAGSYIMTAVDISAQKAHVIIDPIGSLAVYISKVGTSLLVSTNPVALARTGIVDTTPDRTAFAELALLAYTLGERSPVKGIQALARGNILSVDLLSGTVSRKIFDQCWTSPLGETSPPVEDTAASFQRACTRLQLIDPRPAILQSSGMDSRLISASWPKGYNPPSYTYGDPESHEIRIAEMISKKRGSCWTHTWQNGDEIAENADSMFNETGAIMWPDRRFVAKKIASDHHAGVLDGLCGDVLLGGSFYEHNKYFGLLKTLGRLFARPYDAMYSQFSMDRIVEAVFNNISLEKDSDSLENFLNNDFILSIQKERGNILQDIWECLQNTKPNQDSIALLWRNFLVSNRVPHYTVQQGIMCKNYVNVYYPFTNDREFARVAMNIHPKDSMFRRYYVHLYRTCHPDFAAIPYGNTLIPLRRPVLNHKLSAILLSKNLSVPFLTGSSHGKHRDPNGWSIWLKESGKLREYVKTCLASAGFLNKSRADIYFKNVASGKINEEGGLFRLVSTAKWTTIPKPRREVGIST